MSYKKKAMMKLLSCGQYSAIEISNILRIGDARSMIRDLRNSGVPVSDEWKRNKDGNGRHKLYFIVPRRI